MGSPCAIKMKKDKDFEMQKKYLANIKNKNSLFLIYKPHIIFVGVCIGIFILLRTVKKIVSNFGLNLLEAAAILLVIVIAFSSAFYLARAIKQRIVYFAHERKIPLLPAERNKLILNDTKVYAEFLKKYLCNIFPNRRIWTRIVICEYLMIKDRCRLYATSDMMFIQIIPVEFDDTRSGFAWHEIKLEDIIEANFDLEDIEKVSDLKNEIKIKAENQSAFNSLSHELLKNTWLDLSNNTVVSDNIMDFISALVFLVPTSLIIYEFFKAL